MKLEGYPRIEQLGIKITPRSMKSPPGVSSKELMEGLKRNKLSPKTFSKLFGVQTCGMNGMYPWDVEAVLERMISRKRTGTQLHWD